VKDREQTHSHDILTEYRNHRSVGQSGGGPLLLPATAFKIWALSELTTPMATQDASASATPNACSAENQILSSPA